MDQLTAKERYEKHEKSGKNAEYRQGVNGTAQVHPEIRIKTKTVQYWRNGIMMTAQMSQSAARELVRKGGAFVISSQAIGAIVDGKKSA